MDAELLAELDDALFWAFASDAERSRWMATDVWPMHCCPRVLLAFGYGDVVLTLLKRLHKD